MNGDRGIDDARRRLVELKARFEGGSLDAARYENERRAIERELSDALVAPGAALVGEAPARPSKTLIAGTAAFVLVVAVVGYALTGTPSLAGFGPASQTGNTALAAAPPDAAASDSRKVGLQQIAAMVETLAARMKEHPDDAEGWTMLARSYTVLGRFKEALPAYQRAVLLQPKNAGLLADYADAAAALNGKIDNAESVSLIARALTVDPGHPKALALAGTLAYDRGDYAGAMARWQKIVDALPPGSEIVAQIQASIDDARARLGPGAASAALASAAPRRNGAGAASATTIATDPASGSATAVAGATVSGTVTLAPALAARAAPGDTVFVFARAAGGGRMPLAVQRAKVADLPLSFKLDDSMAMTPMAKLSNASQVIVGARISKSGNAIAQPGDFEGAAAPVAPGATAMKIRIDSVVGER